MSGVGTLCAYAYYRASLLILPSSEKIKRNKLSIMALGTLAHWLFWHSVYCHVNRRNWKLWFNVMSPLDISKRDITLNHNFKFQMIAVNDSFFVKTCDCMKASPPNLPQNLTECQAKLLSLRFLRLIILKNAANCFESGANLFKRKQLLFTAIPKKMWP